ncbi:MULTISPECIES: hypothetical protein [unclassified Spiroplasma]
MKKLWDDFKEFKEVAEKHIKEAEINRKATDEIRNEKKSSSSKKQM